VFEEFRFHMTLTGRVAQDRRGQVHTMLQDEFTRQCGGGAIRIDRIALVRQEQRQAPFRVIGQARLGRNSAG
jgi:hypothetical protein